MIYTDALLDRLRLVGDPELDEVLSSLDPEEATLAHTLLRVLIHDKAPVPDELDPALQAWLRDHAHLPPGADVERLRRASSIFEEHGVLMAFILATDGFVELFANVPQAHVLHYSRLQYHPLYRVLETAQFVIDALKPGGLECADGLLATGKIRLLHAAIRRVQLHEGHSQPEQGVPICQEDLLLTMLTFCYLVVRDLKRLGVAIAAEDAEDLLYFWRIVAQMLGVQAEAMPGHMAAAGELWEAIKRRHFGPSPDGVKLTQALLQAHSELTPLELEGIAGSLMRMLCGDVVADWLEIPHSHWDVLAPVEGTLGALLDLTHSWGTAWLMRQDAALLETRPCFDIPDHLKRRWALRPGKPKPPRQGRGWRISSEGQGGISADFYRVRRQWRVQAQRSEVDAILHDAASYTRWWPALKAAAGGDLGQTGSGHIVVDLYGPFDGRATWSVAQDENSQQVVVTFDGVFKSTAPGWLRSLPGGGTIRPLMAARLLQVMKTARRGLALELSRRRTAGAGG